MKPLLDQSFWSDPDIERCKAGVKLAALWLITNPQTSLIGVCGASVGRFEFETGLKPEALESAIEALPRAFKRFGNTIFVRNYIRHQFGSGEKLKRNNFFVALKSLFLSVKDEELRAFILTEYPEFEEALQRACEGLTKPKDGKDRIGKDEEGMQGEAFPTSLETCLTQIGSAGINRDFAAYVYADWSGRGGKDGAGVKTRWAHYVAKRWTREKDEWAAGCHKGQKKNGSTPVRCKV